MKTSNLKLDFPITPKHEGLRVLYMESEYKLTGNYVSGFPELIDSKGNLCTRLQSELTIVNNVYNLKRI